MPHPIGSHWKGPIRSDAGFISGVPAANGSSTAIAFPLTGTVSINPASIAATSSAETAVTIAGLAAGDIIIFNTPAALETGLAYSGARVSATDTAQVRLTNVTAAAVDGAALTWSYTVIRATLITG